MQKRMQEFNLRSAKIAKKVCFGRLLKEEAPSYSMKVFLQNLSLDDHQGDLVKQMLLDSENHEKELLERIESSKQVLSNPYLLSWMSEFQAHVDRERQQLVASNQPILDEEV